MSFEESETPEQRVQPKNRIKLGSSFNLRDFFANDSKRGEEKEKEEEGEEEQQVKKEEEGVGEKREKKRKTLISLGTKKRKKTPLSSNVEDIEEVDEKRVYKSFEELPFSTLSLIFDRVLNFAKQQECEFSILCSLARVNKTFAKLFALSPSCSISLVVRYTNAFFREKVEIRKFEIDSTPTKESLEPFYHFEEEKDNSASQNSSAVEQRVLQFHEVPAYYVKKTCTVTGPCVKSCWKDIRGVPMVYISKRAAHSWWKNEDCSSEWDRIKTKNWEIRNPLVRLIAFYAQSHTECCHANNVASWLARVKEWPLSKQRKPWSELMGWHENPTELFNKLA